MCPYRPSEMDILNPRPTVFLELGGMEVWILLCKSYPAAPVEALVGMYWIGFVL